MKGLEMSCRLQKRGESHGNGLCSLRAAALGDASGNIEKASSGRRQRRTVVRAGRVLDVRTGRCARIRRFVIEGREDRADSSRPAKLASGLAGDTGRSICRMPTLLPGLMTPITHLTFDLNSLGTQAWRSRPRAKALHGRKERSRHASRPVF